MTEFEKEKSEAEEKAYWERRKKPMPGPGSIYSYGFTDGA